MEAFKKVAHGYGTDAYRSNPGPAQNHRGAATYYKIAFPLASVGRRGGSGSGLAIAGVVWRTRLQNAIAYETVSVERGPIQARVTATGNLNAVVDVLVSSQVSGNIKALYADWNSKVKKGQLVALIDPEIFQAQVDQANATYRSAHRCHVTAQAQIEKAKSDLSSANATEKRRRGHCRKRRCECNECQGSVGTSANAA